MPSELYQSVRVKCVIATYNRQQYKDIRVFNVITAPNSSVVVHSDNYGLISSRI